MVHIRNLSIMRGYGIFDFLKTLQEKPLFLSDYIQRFVQSASAMHLPLSYSKSDLEHVVKDLVAKNYEGKDLGVRLLLTGGFSADGMSIGNPDFAVLTEQLPLAQDPKNMAGGSLVTYRYRREEPSIKSINYSVPIRLKASGYMGSAIDVLYHEEGYLSEASRCNFFLVIGKKILTPSSGVLQGVTRKHTLIVAQQLQLEVQETLLPFSLLRAADEAFITSTTKGVQSITQIDGKPVGKGQPGEITCQLAEALSQYSKDWVERLG